ncbi:FeoA family protein [Rubritalea marina]|uniref:FeoA family protein n=1 Tax=Rubritalea marina TaxID=361055 RepID=UPI00039C694B|nr:FeoA family protein [Rubritalea marina]
MAMKFFRSKQQASACDKMTLSQARPGRLFRVKALEGTCCSRLRQMGFCEAMEVRKLSDGQNMLCTLCGTKLALNRKLADQILVTPA